ncbi:response regulator transcription factor [Streptomyces sp. P9(2023)]|uniref:response regulator transcription factor n=1 Tax=Streptomyces sp. P9(2023) TaxID=3064394 RepID=UPI0028F407A5|nr:response regulator transcription factor [Streptomyces sp. P9(2023)]MDT9687540.1 response regulator transcription factor [Streptomyces sp. P9(2023)]
MWSPDDLRHARTGEPIRIVAVDDHSMLRDALCQLLNAEDDLRVVAESDTSVGLGDLVASTAADVVLLDVEMPDHHAPTVVGELTARFPLLRVLMLSMHDHPPLVQELLARGAHGYLHKSAPRASLLSAIRGVMARDPQLMIALPCSATPGTALQGGAGNSLSPREREVLTHVASALSNRQIANELGITEATVKRHLRNIFEKLGAASRIGAVNKAVEARLIDPAGKGKQPSEQQLVAKRPSARRHAYAFRSTPDAP